MPNVSNNPHQSSVVRRYIDLMQQGIMSSEELVRHCLDVIDKTDDSLRAWISIDREYALTQAREMDDIRKRGMPTGTLHGIPVGIKDIIDTCDLPTEMGSECFSGRRPRHDAAVVERLKEAGAVILGKTVTTELAYMHPAVTRNPRNPAYGPGGSSSGSAAAVATGQVPLAIGSQTHGSVIRPASFCGVYGYKPTRGIISRRGMLKTSFHLDQVGIFASSLGDLAVLADVLGGYDPADPMCTLRPRPAISEGCESEVPIEPTLAWIDLPYADRYSQALLAGCNELIGELGNQVERIPAPRSFIGLIESHRIIYGYELYRSLLELDIPNSDRMTKTLRKAIDSIKAITDDQYHEAMEAKAAGEAWFVRFFYDYDAILTPAAPGIAPRYGEGTGDPCCSTIWTLTGLPCITMPMLVGEDDMPIGIQLVGTAEQDDRLFRTSRWLLEHLLVNAESGTISKH